MEILIQPAGWIGTVLIVVAYYLISNKKVDSESKVYQAMNLFGALGVGVNVLRQEAWTTVALQVAWGIIAIFALIKIYNKGK
jgi:Trk-type K+ transport system membrane component